MVRHLHGRRAEVTDGLAAEADQELDRELLRLGELLDRQPFRSSTGSPSTVTSRGPRRTTWRPAVTRRGRPPPLTPSGRGHAVSSPSATTIASACSPRGSERGSARPRPHGPRGSVDGRRVQDSAQPTLRRAGGRPSSAPRTPPPSRSRRESQAQPGSCRAASSLGGLVQPRVGRAHPLRSPGLRKAEPVAHVVTLNSRLMPARCVLCLERLGTALFEQLPGAPPIWTSTFHARVNAE